MTQKNKRRTIMNGRIAVRDDDTEFVLVRYDGLRVTTKSTDKMREMLAAGNAEYFDRLLDDILATEAKRKHHHAKAEQTIKQIQEAAARGIPIEEMIIPNADPNKPPRRIVRIMPLWKRAHCWLSRVISLHKAPKGPRQTYGPFYLGILPPVEVVTKSMTAPVTEGDDAPK